MGSGGAAACHARALKKNRAFRLEGISSRNHVRARELAVRHGGRFYPSPGQMIRSPAIQAVILAVPPLVQPRYLRLALSRGIPVLSEKPIATTVASARRALRGVRQALSFSGINFCYRTIPQIAWLRSCVRRQAVGTPWQIQVEWILGNRLGSLPGMLPRWKRFDGHGGGVLMNYGIHVLDYLFAGLSKPELIGSTWNRIGGRMVAEAGAMIWKFPQGTATIRLSLITRQTPRHRIRLEGPLGTITVENLSRHSPAGPFRICTQGKMRLPPRPPLGPVSLEGLFGEIHVQWLRSIQKKTSNLPSLAEGLRALALAKESILR